MATIIGIHPPHAEPREPVTRAGSSVRGSVVVWNGVAKFLTHLGPTVSSTGLAFLFTELTNDRKLSTAMAVISLIGLSIISYLGSLALAAIQHKVSRGYPRIVEIARLSSEGAWSFGGCMAGSAIAFAGYSVGGVAGCIALGTVASYVPQISRQEEPTVAIETPDDPEAVSLTAVDEAEERERHDIEEHPDEIHRPLHFPGHDAAEALGDDMSAEEVEVRLEVPTRHGLRNRFLRYNAPPPGEVDEESVTVPPPVITLTPPLTVSSSPDHSVSGDPLLPYGAEPVLKSAH
jgi:hypothetical protein